MSNQVTEIHTPFENLNFTDAGDPRSLVNVCPSVVAERISVIPDMIFELGEEDLAKKANPSISEEYIRISFWEEYKRADRTKSNMNMNNVYASFVTKEYFYKHLILNSYKLAYMILPPKEVQIMLEDIVLLSLKRQREWLMLPPVDENGKVNVKLGMLHQRIAEDSLNRRRGHVLRQTEVTTKNLNVNVATQIEQPRSVAEIEKQIAELEHKTLQLEHKTQDEIAVDVTYEEEPV